jgi:hypothetical protein
MHCVGPRRRHKNTSPTRLAGFFHVTLHFSLGRRGVMQHPSNENRRGTTGRFNSPSRVAKPCARKANTTPRPGLSPLNTDRRHREHDRSEVLHNNMPVVHARADSRVGVAATEIMSPYRELGDLFTELVKGCSDNENSIRTVVVYRDTSKEPIGVGLTAITSGRLESPHQLYKGKLPIVSSVVVSGPAARAGVRTLTPLCSRPYIAIASLMRLWWGFLQPAISSPPLQPCPKTIT